MLVLPRAALVLTLLELGACGGDSPRMAELGTACPAPTVSRGNVCTLLADATLDRTLDVPSGVHLDCAGHRLLPGASPPTIAVIVHDASAVKIDHCRIEGFDQGIYLLRSPTAPGVGRDELERVRNQITDNDLQVRVKGITMWGVEDARIENNRVHFASNFGYGIGVWRGSHRNIVRGNTIDGAAGPEGETAPLDFPPPYVGYQPQEAFFNGRGIVVGTGPAALGLIELIVNGTLFQLVHDPALSGVQDNLIEDNQITVASTSKPAGIHIAAGNRGTILRGNTITGAAAGANGIVVVSGSVTAARFPSTCVRRKDRFCHTDADCNLLLAPGEAPDSCAPTVPACLPDSPAGECWSGVDVADADFRCQGMVIENNDLRAGLDVGIDDGSALGRIAGNRVSGALTAGIALRNVAVDGATVERNVLQGNRVGLAFATNRPAPAAVVTRNDVVGSLVRPLSAPAGWKTRLDLSRDGAGNHWGQACPDAFRPLPAPPRSCTGAADVTCVDDAACAGKGVCGTTAAEAPNDFLTDAHPYGEPVAGGTTVSPCR